MLLLSDPATSLIGIYLKDTLVKTQKDICMELFIAGIFIYPEPFHGCLSLGLCERWLYPHSEVLFSSKRMRKFSVYCYGIK